MNHFIEVKVADHVGKVVLNRPEAMNAWTSDMIQEFIAQMNRLDHRDDIHVIVVTGTGKAFCSGGDIKAMKDQSGMFAGDQNELRRHYEFGIQQIPKMMEQLQTPVVAMINGHAIGAGLDLALMCDLRICAREVKLGETFVKLGLVPGDGGTYFLIRTVGFAKACEMALTGKTYSADEALSFGLVHQVVDSDKLEATVEKVCHDIKSNAPIAVSMTKKALRVSYREHLYSVLDLLSSYQGITQRTQEHFDRLKS
ncbi:MAG: crotonase/enoyl-CoA hydratase family protein [Bdellovibrio sp.]